MTPALKLSAGGFAATFVTYGPARMGFGLFLPELRSTFSLSIEAAGMIASLGFLGFLLGLLAATVMTSRWGPRAPVLFGLLAATSGMGLVALAPSLPVLAIGVVVAMSSAGFSWAPFNDAVQQHVPVESRPGALSAISTGTSLGIAAAGMTALLLSISGISWRAAWGGFAAAGIVAALANWKALAQSAREHRSGAKRPWAILVQNGVWPLYAIALSFGTTTAIYISFAADRVEQAGGLPGLPVGTSPAMIFIAFGIFGLLGLFTGRARAAIGLSPLVQLLLLASALSLLLIAMASTSLAAIIASAGLQGVFVMMMSAVMAFWSERLFPQASAFGFTAVLLAVAMGSVLGPLAAGFIAGALGEDTMFVATAAMSALTFVVALPRFIMERPVAGR